MNVICKYSLFAFLKKNSLTSQNLLIKPCCVIMQSRNNKLLELLTRELGQRVSRKLGWSIHRSQFCLFLRTNNTTVTCYSALAWFLSLPTCSKDPLQSPSPDDRNGKRLDPFINQKSERKRKYSSRIVTHALAAALFKSEAELSGCAWFPSHFCAQTAVIWMTCFTSNTICRFSSA